MAEVPFRTTWAVTWLLDSLVMFFIYNFPVLHDEEGKLRWGELLHNCSGSRPWLFPHQLSHIHSALWSHDLFPFHMCTLYLTSVCIAAKATQNNTLPSEEELFSASSPIRPYALQLDTCCFHGFRAQAEFPLLLLTFPPPLLSITRASSSTLVSFHFFFCSSALSFLSTPLWRPNVHDYSSP